MNRNLSTLFTIAQKKERTIIGLMSGTSVDGLDIVLCKIKGNGLQTKVEIIDFETIHYSSDFKNEIKSVFSKKDVDFEKLSLLNPLIALEQADMINAFLIRRNIDKAEINLIASHGQTVYHIPKALHQQEKIWECNYANW